MQEKILTALTKEGYKGVDIFEYERCLHKFQILQSYNVTDDLTIECIITTKCNKCGCDDHAALLMGLNPIYLDGKERYV